MFWAKKRKKVKLKGKTQILKQKQTTFSAEVANMLHSSYKNTVQQVCKLGFRGEKKGKGVS